MRRSIEAVRTRVARPARPGAAWPGLRPGCWGAGGQPEEDTHGAGPLSHLADHTWPPSLPCLAGLKKLGSYTFGVEFADQQLLPLSCLASTPLPLM